MSETPHSDDSRSGLVPSEPLEGSVVDDEQSTPSSGETRVEFAYSHMRGPLPPARILREYEDVMPGLAGRIVSMAEGEQAHRHKMDELEVKQPYLLAKRGQTLGFAVVLAVLVFAGVLAILGSPVAAAIVTSVDVVALAVVFVRGQRADDATDEGDEKKAEDDREGDEAE